jgi:hypothetical protein
MATKRIRRVATKTTPDDPEGEAEEAVAPASGKGSAELIEDARTSLMKAIPRAATALVKGATGGSVPHIKLLLQLVGLDEAGFAPVVVRPQEKTLEEIVMEQWYREP